MPLDPQPFLGSKWEGLNLPQRGDPWDSRFGGPTPWQMSIQNWSQMGNVPGQRPFEGLGKFDITQNIPLAPHVTPQERNAPIQKAPPPAPGLFESLGRGLPTMFLQFLGNGDLTKFGADLGGFVGSIADTPFRVIPSMDFLSGGYTVDEMFNALPEDAQKREYESYIAADKSSAMRYMSEYLDRHGTEVARKMGISGAFAPMLTPSADFATQMRRIIFGGLGAAGQGVARTFVGSSLRDVTGTILDAKPGTLPPELQDIQNRWQKGEFKSKDEVYDELSNGAFRWTNDDSLWGRGLSLIMDIVSDPVTWASFGLMGGASAVESGAMRSGANAVSKVVREAGLEDASLAARGITAADRAGWAKMVGSDGINREMMNWARTQRPDLYERGLQGLSGWQRGQVAIEPLIRPAAQVADSINNMFGFFGVGAVGRQLSSKVVHARLRGFASYYGARRLKSLQDFFGPDRFDDYSRYVGIAGSNVNLSLHQKNLAREAMGTDPNWRGLDLTPQERVLSRMDIDQHFSVEAERHTASISKDFLPAGAGKAAVEAARKEAIATLARDLSLISGKTVEEATAFLQKQDTRGLALAHQVVYGQTVAGLSSAKRDALAHLNAERDAAVASGDAAALEAVTERMGHVERYTLVSERNLTQQRAADLLKEIDAPTDAARARAREAVEQYDTLGHSYGSGKLTAEDLRVAMADHLRELLADPENRLIRTVDPASLHPDIQRAMAGSKYEVGLRPEDTWGITRGPDGVVRGVNTFLDATDEHMPDSIVRPWGRRDVLKERFFSQIHGARLFYEAEAKFKELGQSEYGLSHRDAISLFRGIHKEAQKQEIGVRGLSPDEVVRIANDLELTPSMRARVGPGSLMELVLRSFEGDLATVGLAPKVSGGLKTASSRLGNWLGIISERYYPKLRFGLSPIFVMMESVEGPFFMLLRGIKPGVHWTQKDLRMNAILEYMHPGLERYTDQLERAQSATIDLDMARRLSGVVGGTQPGGWKRLLPTNWHRGNPLEKGILTSGVWDNKHLQYVKHTGKAASEQWNDWMNRNAPELHARWMAEMGTSSPQELFMRFMEERGAFTENARHLIHMMDAVKPTGLGKRERIRVGDVAHYHGFDTTQELYDAVASGGLQHDAFVNRYTRLNVPPEYAERVWRIVTSPTEDDWKSALNEALGVEASKGFLNFHSLMAAKQGKTLREFLSDEYGAVPSLLDSPAGLPATAVFRQQTLRESIERAGLKFHGKGDPKYDAALAQVKVLGPDLPTPEVTKTGKYENEQLANIQRGRSRINDPAIMPERWRGKRPMEIIDQTIADGMNDFGGDMAAINHAMDWYDNMMSVFVAMSEGAPDSMVHGLLETWRGRNPKGIEESLRQRQARLEEEAVLPGASAETIAARDAGRLRLGGSAESGGAIKAAPPTLSLDEARAELAARLMVAFSGSQMNSSVLSGMRSILSTLDHGAFKQGTGPIGMDVVKERLTALLEEFKNLPPSAIGLKLFDFYDSLAGNTRRSVSSAINDALQPAAMDIWMRRVWGYGDSAYLNKMALFRLQRDKKPITPENIAAAEEEFAREMGWNLEEARARANTAPSEYEYEWMLQKTNELAAELNRSGIIKNADGTPRTNITAAQAQAWLWVGLQRRMAYADSPPLALLRQAGVQQAAEVVPGRGSHLANWMPSQDDILRLDAGGDAAMAMDISTAISHDIQTQMLPIISEETGALTAGQLDAVGRWSPGDGTPMTLNANGTTIYSGSERQFLAAMRLTGLLQEQEVIYGLGAWPEVALKPSRNKPIIRSNADSGRKWSLDLSFGHDLKQHEVQPYFEPLTRWFEKRWIEKTGQGRVRPTVGRGPFAPRALPGLEFPGSMVGVLDDGSIAIRHTWEQGASRVLKDRAEQAQRDITRIENIKPKQRTEADKVRLADARKERDRGINEASLEDFTNSSQLSPADLQALQDGTWVHEFDPEAKPMPVTVERNPVQEYYLDGDHAAALKELGVDADAVRSRHQETVRGLYLDSYRRHAPSATESRYAQRTILDGANGYFAQRNADGGLRGAFAPASAHTGASTYFLRNAADATTGVHESFHLFARHLQPSSVDGLLRAFNDAHGLTGRSARRVLGREVEEWLAYEFEKFAAGDYSKAGEFGNTFKAYAKWAEDHHIPAGSTMDGVFTKVLKDWGDVEGHVFDPETERVWEAGRLALLRGEDEAHTTSYYKHSRTWVERSINHPYLGLYPISYMWGKVLPELTRFLVRRPFGLKAPLGGLAAAATVWRNVQMQLDIDENLRKWIDDHPESIRLLAMMTPGTPWELPVNMPAVFRHLQERDAENVLRQARGLPPLGFDFGAAASDSIQYSVGYSNVLERAGKILPELTGIGRDVGQGVASLPGDMLNSYTSLDTTP